jgi:hypothetical protein
MSFITLNPVAPILSIAPKRERRIVILLCSEYRNPGRSASVQRYRDAQRPELADCDGTLSAFSGQSPASSFRNQNRKSRDPIARLPLHPAAA